MQAQDWKPVVWRKDPRKMPEAELKRKGLMTTVLKGGKLNAKRTDTLKRELIEGTEIKAIKLVGKELGLQMQQARVAKSLSQKQLAQTLHVHASVIQDWETGKAKYEGSFMNSLGKILGVHFKRKKEG
jgi:ribosome-binding protein aMBF1 (putative translation factor)